MQTLPSVSLSLEDSEMVAKMSNDDLENVSLSNDNEKGSNEERDEHSDSESVKDSVSTRGGAQTNGVKKVGSKSGGNNKLSKNVPLDSRARSIRERTEKIAGEKKQIKTSNSTPKKSARTNGGVTKVTPNTSPGRKSQNIKVHPKPSSESSEGTDDKSIGDVKDIDRLDEVQNGSQTTGSDNESADVEENGINESQELVDQRLEEMELRIKTLEDELREIAALEISLYSVVPEHGNSAHKVHTPARRLSRLYIHACKQWSQAKRASIAKNTASGLVLVAKSCGNDVPRLTFWLSNTVVLREIISQAFGNSVQSSSITRMIETNGSMKKLGKPSSFKWKGSASSKRGDNGFTQFVDDWQETRTFTAALEKIESWIFSRIVESVWWQTLTPHMQSPAEDTYSSKGNGRVSGPSLGDQKQGCFSVNLWRSAFQDAFQKLCPVRAGGHECGCLPVLARMVMEQCVSRLDVAMFNAILRESAHDIPTDPVSDPIVDSKVLPIPAGDLSFGSGAQLKNSVGNWSRWLTDLFGMEIDETSKDEINGEDDGTQETDIEPKSFPLLNDLSDLLMLPKDMLIDRSIRKEVCPSIGLPLVLRILCNFTPDEFCPDPVPGAVLEALSSENFVLQRRISSNGESSSSFPHSAAPVVYSPPSPADVAAKVAYAEMKSQLERNVSIIQRKGYTSDDELDELESPLGSIFDKTPKFTGNENGGKKDKANCNGGNVRYDLLREVWKG